MSRTLTITLEVVLDHMAPHEIDDLDDFVEESGLTTDEAAASILTDATDDEVAACLLQGCFDPEIFAGSMLYLKVLDASVVKSEWRE